MDKTYPPQLIETHCLKQWAPLDYFSPEGSNESYCIALPPPNVTGSLHMGHGFQVSLMDALVRYHRMQGRRVLWQGGVDHAGIATQMVVERQLAAQNKPKESLKREELLAHVSEWKDQSEKRITSQLQRLGASIDFSKNRFTFDEGFGEAINRILIQLYEEGLLYRGKRLVNWDSHWMTAISDLEVVHSEEAGWLYYIRYPLVGSDDYITVATTRPETLLGDVAIAVHPDDQRYKHWIGCEVKIPLIDRRIPIIADAEVVPDFGTGCVKITPAHDFNDYKIGQRHQLPLINILTPKATLNEQAPKAYQGMSCAKAREAIVKDLEKYNQLDKKQVYTVKVPRGDRSGVVIEPYLTNQWFIHMKPLAKKAIIAIETKQVEFVPANWSTTCLQWLYNIEDWCISRQLWWGHRIPAWYDQHGNCFFGANEQSIRKQYTLNDSITLIQDEDVLDTWVSSALWPFVTLGWPNATENFKTFYPTNVLVTGFDIIFFWVARMLMFALHFTKQIPFKTVYVTGLIRDHLGQKMSKSKGNVLDPLDVIEGIDQSALLAKRMQGLMQPSMKNSIEKLTKEQFPKGIDAYGADALRMTYYSLASPTRDIRFDINRTLGYRNFCNKLWQVTRFVINQYSTPSDYSSQVSNSTLVFDRWILSRLQKVIQKAHEYFANYRFDLLTQLLYDFVWHDYCDWYVELIKPILKSDNQLQIQKTRHTLTIVLKDILRLLHPLMPFITETLWFEVMYLAQAEHNASFQAVRYPQFSLDAVDVSAEAAIEWLQKLVKTVRAVKSEYKIPNHQTVELFYQTNDEQDQKNIKSYQPDIERLIKGTIKEKSTIESENNQAISFKLDALTLSLTIEKPLEDTNNLNRLKEQQMRLEKELYQLERRLNNAEFVSKAPIAVVDKVRKQAATVEEYLAYVMSQLKLSINN